MSDPRGTTEWKTTRIENKILLMLGAILDAIYALNRKQEQVVTPPTPRRTKAN